MLAIVLVESKYKARWLGWWHSSDMLQEPYRFPLYDVKKTELGTWVVKALIWAHVIIKSLYVLVYVY